MTDERLIEYANDLADNCVDWYAQDVDDSYIIDSLKAVVAEQKAIDIERFLSLIDSLNVDKLYKEAQVLSDGSRIPSTEFISRLRKALEE